MCPPLPQTPWLYSSGVADSTSTPGSPGIALNLKCRYGASVLRSRDSSRFYFRRKAKANYNMTPNDSPLDVNAVQNAANPTTPKPGKFDPARLRLNQSFEAGAVNKSSPITVRKPDRHNWFMAHPDPSYHFQTMMLDIKQDREIYLIDPDLREELALELVPRLLVPCITRQNNIFLWPVSLPDSTGRVNTWTQSAMEAVQKAMLGWIRLVANIEGGGYDVYSPRVTLDAPKWPNLTLEEMLEKAFKHHLIDSMEHPRILALLGEV